MVPLFGPWYHPLVEPDKTLAEARSGAPVRTIHVEVLEGPDKGLSAKEDSPRLSIGTAESNGLVLHDELVSRYHVDLIRSGDRIEVVDHDSTNGTQIGGAWVKHGYVSPGATIRLGRTVLRVADGDTIITPLYGADRLGSLLGRSPVMRELMEKIQRAAQVDRSVLILGETGTGKEIIARTIHENSGRASGPFETVDCASMVETLITSELFGHEKGAFTSADSRHIGAFERADGGTLFLDEIGELSPTLQAALLGVIERREFRRIGGREKISVNIRIICATHRDLRAEVNAGRFRQDLYFRIAIIPILPPPLRERLEDIPLLAEHFLRSAGFDGRLADVLTPEVLAGLAAQRWPGNVRELRNAVEVAWLMGQPPEQTKTPGDEVAAAAPTPGQFQPGLVDLPYNVARGRLLEEFENHYLRELMERAEGNISEAARRAQMDRTHLSRMLKKKGYRTEKRFDERG